MVVHGLDVSPSALMHSHEYLAKYGLRGVLTEGSATGMPYPPESIDVFIFSAIMHEIYSYVPDGRQAWAKAISEIAQKTSPGGVLLLRDFAAPNHEGYTRLLFKSRIAADFYHYFSREFRAFAVTSDQMRESMLDRRSGNDSYLPRVTAFEESVRLPTTAAAEVLLHFKNFCDHVNRGFTNLDDVTWKELNEVYLPPDPFVPGFYPMSQSAYVEQIEMLMSCALRGTPYSMTCVENGRSTRPNHAAFLAQHFHAEYPDLPLSSEEVIAGFTCKMELVFSKTSSR